MQNLQPHSVAVLLNLQRIPSVQILSTTGNKTDYRSLKNTGEKTSNKQIAPKNNTTQNCNIHSHKGILLKKDIYSIPLDPAAGKTYTRQRKRNPLTEVAS